MIRPFLFLAGEFSISMPLVFSRHNWQHTMTAKPLFFENGALYRKNVQEKILGAIFLTNIENEEIKLNNLNTLAESKIPCFPDPCVLLKYTNRHEVMRMCIDNDLVSHTVLQGQYKDNLRLDFPFVIKAGNLHCGEGKFLIKKEEDIPQWEDIATIEPFFNGNSVRILWIEETPFMIKVENETSWIKNIQGAEISLIKDIPKEIIDHSRKVKDFFGLDLAGIDYILEENNDFHFLEYNQFPGIPMFEETIDCSKKFLNKKMEMVERLAGY